MKRAGQLIELPLAASPWPAGIEGRVEVSGDHHDVAGRFPSLRSGLHARGGGRVRALGFRCRTLP